MKVIFSHNLKDEIEYHLKLNQQKSWFEENSFPVKLPQSKKFDKDNFNQNVQGVADIQKKVEKDWYTIEDDFFKILSGFKNLEIYEKYYCHISEFGPEGQYFYPDHLIIKVDQKLSLQRICETIAHEILHLTLIDYFDKSDIEYEESENIVDGIFAKSTLKKLFPSYESQKFTSNNNKIVFDIISK